MKVFQGSDEKLQEVYQNHQRTVKEKERRLTDCQKELERAGRECQRLNRVKADLLVEQGRLQLEADRHTHNIKSRDTLKQQSIDEMRDKKTGLERTVELKRDMQGKKQQELRNIRADLQKLERSSSRLQELENELAKAERELQRALQSSNVDELRAEIEELQKEKTELDRAQRQLDHEMQILNTHTTACTQMDMLKKDKV
ncbi:hypothetical protein XENOCAPTIV_003739 [Xenoophorus captivus]|uniref:Uncharacterized protein n=1 Tax=Xenoophorus captivus TaxID=1517983 RepID=A0ABV0RNJ8_9TELE